MKCFKFFAIHETLFSGQILRKIGVQAVFSNFPVTLTCSKKGSSSGHSFFFCTVSGFMWGTLYYIHLTDSCIAWVLYWGSTQHFLQNVFLKGVAFQSSLGSFSCITYSRKKGLVTVCLFLGPVVSSLKNYSNLNLYIKTYKTIALNFSLLPCYRFGWGLGLVAYGGLLCSFISVFCWFWYSWIF